MNELKEALQRIEAVTGQRKVAAEFLIPNNAYMDTLLRKSNIPFYRIQVDSGSSVSLFGIPVVVDPFLPPDKGMFVDADRNPLVVVSLGEEQERCQDCGAPITEPDAPPMFCSESCKTASARDEEARMEALGDE